MSTGRGRVSYAESTSSGSSKSRDGLLTGGLQRDLRNAVNVHIENTFAHHRLRYVTDEMGEMQVHGCLCGFQGDRGSFNDHLQKELMV